MALNLTLRAPQDESCSRWEFNNDNAGRDESHVKKLILGQLVFYRHKHDSKFRPNAAPGLSAGWRLEPGGIYRDVTLVLDLEKLRSRPGAWTDPVSVPESELYVRSGAPVFPPRNAAEHALLTFADDGEIAAQDPLPFPFTPHVFTDQGERKKLRRIYITYARFRKIGPTPGCSACDNDKSNHNAECIARFEKAFGRESKAPETPAPKELLSYEELMLPRPEARAEGEHLSDYEPSEAGVEESPAQLPSDIRSLALLCCSRLCLIPDLASPVLPMNQAFVWCQYRAIKLISPIPPSLISLSVRFQLSRVVASAVPSSVMVAVLSNPVTVTGRRIERF